MLFCVGTVKENLCTTGGVLAQSCKRELGKGRERGGGGGGGEGNSEETIGSHVK